ncbi:NTP transferase domain-containing protein [Streptomyces sp. NPDC054842]
MTAHQPPGAAVGTAGAGGVHAPGAASVAYDAVVLAGGGARRLGGADKPGVRVGGRALLDRVLAACAGARTTVVVAAPRPTARPVVWTREDPPGAGPVAALGAGLRHTAAEYVVVLSADLPFLTAETVRRLLSALLTGDAAPAHAGPGSSEAAPVAAVPDGPAPAVGPRPDEAAPSAAPGGPGPDPAVNHSPSGIAPHSAPKPSSTPLATASRQENRRLDGVVLVDRDGREQPLVAVYRAAALRRALEGLAGARGGLDGLPLRQVTAVLELTRLPDPVASFDCDTWDDIATARSRIREHGLVLDEWISAVKDELGIDLDVDTGILLDLARDAAHSVARPSAPLTTFLVGYAAGRAGGGPEAVAEAARKASALALAWEAEAGTAPPPGKSGEGAAVRPDAG